MSSYQATLRKRVKKLQKRNKAPSGGGRNIGQPSA